VTESDQIYAIKKKKDTRVCIIQTSSWVTPRVNKLRHGTGTSLMSTSDVTAPMSADDGSCTICPQQKLTNTVLATWQRCMLSSHFIQLKYGKLCYHIRNIYKTSHYSHNKPLLRMPICLQICASCVANKQSNENNSRSKDFIRCKIKAKISAQYYRYYLYAIWLQ